MDLFLLAQFFLEVEAHKQLEFAIRGENSGKERPISFAIKF